VNDVLVNDVGLIPNSFIIESKLANSSVATLVHELKASDVFVNTDVTRKLVLLILAIFCIIGSKTL
jgi:hypothetical protein